MARKHRIHATITAEARDFLSKTKRVGQNLKTVGDLWSQFARRAAAASAVANGAILGTALAGARAGDALAKNARRVGLTAEAYQELTFAAQQSGAGSRAVVTSIRRLSQAALDAQIGLEETARAFRILNVNVEASKGVLKDSQTLFYETADALAGMKDQTAALAIAVDLFGRGATELLPLWKQGADGIKAYRRELEILGIAITNTEAKNSELVVDSIGRVKEAFKALSVTLADTYSKDLIKAANKLALLIGNLRDFIKNNKELVIQLAKSVATVGAMAAAFLILAQTVAAAGAAISGMATFLAGPFGVASGLFVAAMGAMVAINLAFFNTFEKLINSMKGRILILWGAGKFLEELAQRNVFPILTEQMKGYSTALRFGASSMMFLVNTVESAKGAYDKLKKGLDDLEKHLSQAPPKIDAYSGGLANAVQQTDKLAEALAALRDQMINQPIAKFLAQLKGLSQLGIKLDPTQFLDDLRVIQRLAKNEMEGLRGTLFIPFRGVFGGADLENKIKELNDRIRKELESRGEEIRLGALAGGFVGPEMTEAQKQFKELEQQFGKITSKVQYEAIQAFVQFGDIGTRVSQTLIDNFLAIGDGVGNFIRNLSFGSSEMEQLQQQLRTQELQQQIATTEEAQEKWNASIDETRRKMAQVELAAIRNKSAFGDFFKAVGNWIKNLIADLAAVVTKFLILKTLSKISFFGGILPIGLGNKGGLVQGAQGGIVYGGVSGRDSVPAMLTPGELIVPADKVADALAGITGGPGPLQVTVQAGAFMGSQADASAIALRIRDELNFLEFGSKD